MLAVSDAASEAFSGVVVVGFLALIFWFVWRSWFRGLEEARRSTRWDRMEEGLCPGCGYDVRTGHARCPECGEDLSRAADAADDPDAFDVARLSSEWPATPIEPVASHEPMELLLSLPDGALAELVVDQLMARGVWCSVERSDGQVLVGSYVRGVTDFRISVPVSERERAQQILDGFRGRRPAATPERSQHAGP